METGTLAEQLGALESGLGVVRLADAGVVRVRGAGHREVLQRVLSQDLAALATGQGRIALLLAPKGQFRAVMAVLAGVDETLLLPPPGRAAELAAALSKYLLLSRCAAEPVARPGGAVAVVGARWLDGAAAAGASPAALAEGGWSGGSIDGERTVWLGRTMLGVAGALAFDASAEVEAALAGAGAVQVSREAVELGRIRLGAPAWGAELTDSVLPPEVGIEAEAVSYTKGCYIGQETIARMATYGHPTRALAGLRQLGSGPEPPDLPLPLTAAGEEKPRGSLTSWAWHPRVGGVGLAVVRRELAAPGTRLSCDGREFEVAPFPLW